jgi:hypothetical protein
MLLQGHRPEWKLDDGSVDGLFVFSENALPCALEGLEEDELLRRDGGTKRVFIGVFVLLAPPPLSSSSPLAEGLVGYLSREASLI